MGTPMIRRLIYSIVTAVICAALIGYMMYSIMLQPFPIAYWNLIFVASGIVAVMMYLWCFFVVWGDRT
jgi:hypothetical protein